MGGNGYCPAGQHHLHQQEHVLSSLWGIWGGGSKRAYISGPQAAGEICQHTGIDIKTDIKQRRDLFPDQNLKEGSVTLISSKKMTFFFDGAFCILLLAMPDVPSGEKAVKQAVKDTSMSVESFLGEEGGEICFLDTVGFWKGRPCPAL